MAEKLKAEDLQDLHGCASFHLKRVTRTVTRFYDKHLQGAGLRSTQFAVLAALSGAEVVSVTELANWLGMDHSTLVRNLRPLARQGLVESRSGEDRRRRMLSLSEQGEATLARALPLWRRAQEEILQVLDEEEWRRTMHVLAKLHKKAEGKE